MIPLAFDSETALIRPALLAPQMACLTWHTPGDGGPHIEHAREAGGTLEAWLCNPTVLLTAHNAAFDAAVVCANFPELIPLVFKAYRENRITCTKKRQQLLDIAGGVYRGRVGEKGRWIVHKYDLDALSRRHLNKPLAKDGWRMHYDKFIDVPLDRWVERAKEMQGEALYRRTELMMMSNEHQATKKARDEFMRVYGDEIRDLDAMIGDVPEGVIRYPLDDATTCLGILMAQEKHADYLKDQFRQAYADFVLYLSSAWGLRTYGPGVEALKAELADAHEDLEEELQALGMVRDNGTRNMKAIKEAMVSACREYGLPIRRTDAHAKRGEPPCPEGEACMEHVCLDSDACQAIVDVAAESPFVAYAEFSAITKMLNNDVAMLERGSVYPVHTHYDIAETGRTTSSGPNIQNLNTGRVKNKKSQAQRLRKGVRQAFIPRPGHVFFQADYPQLELYTLAQCCMTWLGFSKLAEAINSGLDPHLAFAATALGITYAEAAANKKRKDVDHMRQVGKVFNFGKPGGLGVKTLVVFARKTYGVELTEEQVQAYTNQWHDTFPEMRQYFARVNAMFGDDVQRASVETLFTERHRGGATYCAACNNGFQALGVDCAKCAMCLVAEQQYVGPGPLFGSRTVAMVHDELIGECLDDPSAHDCAMELGRLMVEGANRYLPDVPMKLERFEPTLMRVWSKDAIQVWDSNKRLIPWAP